jgi:oxygen-independent coproporphyrinogen III oxidase
MSDSANHNSRTLEATMPAAADTLATTEEMIRHIYVHIPFCARICPYCAFYKTLMDPSQTQQFCAAILRELEQHSASRKIVPSTVYFGGGTPTALSTSQLEFLLRGFRERLDLWQVKEWTIEANPGSVSARKADMLQRFSVNRISLGVQSWDDELLRILGREHNAQQAEKSFFILRDAGFSNINVDLMFGLPGQTREQWQATLEKTITLRPEHISAYCLTYEEDTEFFLRHSRGELRSNTDIEADFFEMTMSILEEAGYEHYEISNYARPGCSSMHNRAYWTGQDYLGIGPSAFSTRGLRRWQNIADYREYTARIFRDQSTIGSTENLTLTMKRSEKIALSLRTRDGVSGHLLDNWPNETGEFIARGLLRRSNGNFVLTRAGKLLADSVAEAFL